MAWEQHQKDSLHELLLSGIGHSNFDVLTLYDKSTAISVGEFVLGSSKSWFSQNHTLWLSTQTILINATLLGSNVLQR